MKKRKRYVVILVVLLAFIVGYNILNKIVKDNYEKRINDVSTYNEMIEISIPEDSTVLKLEDSHGGFLGDGESYVDIQLTDKGIQTFINKINKTKKWSQLPFTKEIELLVYGGEYDGIDYGKLINMPKDINNGMYYFKDRYADQYPNEANTDINSRSSYNFTIAILDLDKNKLYICKYDS